MRLHQETIPHYIKQLMAAYEVRTLYRYTDPCENGHMVLVLLNAYILPGDI